MDLRFGAKMEESIAARYNQIAQQQRIPFTEFIGKISVPHQKNIDWWVAELSSRHALINPLFHHCCILVLLQELLEAEKFPSQLLVDSPAMQLILQDFLSQHACSSEVLWIQPTWKQKIKQILRPFLDPPRHMATLLWQWIQCKRSALPHASLPPHSLVLIDNYIIPSSLKKDRYYPCLWENLNEEEQKSVYFVPTLVLFSYQECSSAFQELRQSSINYLFKEDFLKLSDYLYAFLHVWRIQKCDIKQTEFSGINVQSLMQEELKARKGIASVFIALLNFRFSKRLKESGVQLSRVIDWFENQVLDKGWNAGFRKYYPDVATIGYQGFPGLPYYLCLYPAQHEEEAEVLPETVALMGEGHAPSSKVFFSEMKLEMAPAFRFQHLWKKKQGKSSQPTKTFTVLVALTILEKEALLMLQQLLSVQKTLEKMNAQVWIKPHPTTNPDVLKESFDACKRLHFEIILDGDFNLLLEQADLFIGSISSTCLETLASGTPVIVLGNPYGLTHVPIPETIPQELWRLCHTQTEISEALLQFHKRDEKTLQHYQQLGKQIRKDYFEPVTREGVLSFLGFTETMKNTTELKNELH